MRNLFISIFISLFSFCLFSQNTKTSTPKKQAIEKTAIVTYDIGEDFGYCNVIFKTLIGEELRFMNPNIDKFIDPELSACEFMEKYQNKKFKIRYKEGKVKVFSQDAQGEEVVNGLVLLDIQISD